MGIRRKGFKRNGGGFYAGYDRTRREDNILYKKFRQIVRKRDKNTCQMPNCDHKCKLLQVHHVMLWAHCPLLRYEERNGILLCKTCHERIRGNEAYYIELFTNIILKKYDNTN